VPDELGLDVQHVAHLARHDHAGNPYGEAHHDRVGDQADVPAHAEQAHDGQDQAGADAGQNHEGGAEVVNHQGDHGDEGRGGPVHLILGAAKERTDQTCNGPTDDALLGLEA
jgi:hypothetical protein